MREEDSPLAFDVVVVGSGTGLLAAVTAGELDLRALVVEKSEYLGGSTAMSGGGFWIPGNSCSGTWVCPTAASGPAPTSMRWSAIARRESAGRASGNCPE